MTGVYGHQTRPHNLRHMSIDIEKNIEFLFRNMEDEIKERNRKRAEIWALKSFRDRSGYCMEERNLDLVARNEDTRDKFHTEVIRFELDQILQHFAETIQAINAQFDVADELFASGKVIEGENIWRAQIIFLASGFDFYMHELTKYGLCEIYDENWERTDKYKNLQVNMNVIEVALKSGEDIDWFLEYINGYYRAITMVSYESVREQLNLLGIHSALVAEGAFYQR